MTKSSRLVEHRKPKSERKEFSLQIRMTKEQKVEIEAAAARDVQDVSAWIRRVALREARQSYVVLAKTKKKMWP